MSSIIDFVKRHFPGLKPEVPEYQYLMLLIYGDPDSPCEFDGLGDIIAPDAEIIVPDKPMVFEHVGPCKEVDDEEC